MLELQTFLNVVNQPEIYGGVWVGKDSPIPNVRGIRSDVVQALRALKVPNVRWPGGCFAVTWPCSEWRQPFCSVRKRDEENCRGPADTDIGTSDTDYTEAVMKHGSKVHREAAPSRDYLFTTITGGELGTMRDPAVGFGDKEYATFVKNTYVMDDLIARHSAIMDRYDPEKKVALAVDEWGVWLKPMPGTLIFYIQQSLSRMLRSFRSLYQRDSINSAT